MNQAVTLPIEFVPSDSIRSQFSRAMSDMYRTEVPAYGALIDLVEKHNQQVLADSPQLADSLKQVEDLDTLSEQRHGAIRVGKASELAMMGRIFAIMGMQPVGYYDLSVANVPVHSTAFRAVDSQSLRNNPFRIFTSLLRLELIKDETLREKAQQVLDKRDIFSEQVRELVATAEENGGLDEQQAALFITEIVEIFRWHSEAAISDQLYSELLSEHPLIADVVSFKGPHINHLTPRTLDIDWVQENIHTTGAQAKAVIEGPPQRNCPILLRQTAFLAIKEEVSFIDAQQQSVKLTHAARFGEIEQRGCALTAKGRDLYDGLLTQTRELTRPLNDGSNLAQYKAEIQQVFSAFPDDYQQMHDQQLAFFKYSVVADAPKADVQDPQDIQQWVAAGAVRFDPITYEDFLPVSAAGIFQSNLGEQGAEDFSQNPNQTQFENDLGMAVADQFSLYQSMQTESIEQCLELLAK